MSPINALILNYFFDIRAAVTDRRGVTALEYGLIAALIGVAILLVLTSLGTNMASEFNFLATKT